MNITRQDEQELLADAAKVAREQGEHAQVGALLAKCRYLSIEQLSYQWVATVMNSKESTSYGYGPTQLAAIKAAVKAAEQGVGE